LMKGERPRQALRTYWLLAGLLASMLLAVYAANPGEERYLVPYFFALVLYGVPGVLGVLFPSPPGPLSQRV